MQIDLVNTNDSAKFYREMALNGVSRESRNGPVLRLPGVTVLRYLKPWERVNFCPVRDANPFFHLMEGLAILGGINSVGWLCRFNEGMRQYSDDDKTWNSFYGTRLKIDFGGDQIREVVKVLKRDPNTRQAVCQIWDANDLIKITKDKACNMSIVFEIEDHKLNMTVFNRSNDAIWGSVTGANVVHFSMIQEYVAHKVGVGIGEYYQVSNNMHVYTDNPQWEVLRAKSMAARNYELVYPAVFHFIGKEGFDEDLDLFLRISRGEYIIDDLEVFKDEFMKRVAVPAYNAFISRKYYRDMDECFRWLSEIEADDWRTACFAWVERKEAVKC